MRLIDGDELLKPVGSYERVKYTYEYGDVVTVEDIELMPTIEAEPIRHGKWIKVGCSHFGVSTYECSVCHYTDEHNESREVPYCWQCGALMKGVEE